jgi:hypothetical protein
MTVKLGGCSTDIAKHGRESECQMTSNEPGMTLTAFLLQRIAEDAEAARKLNERILAELAAKRAVAELVKVADADGLGAEAWAMALEAAHALAAVYAGHPDYDPEWKV